MSVQKINVTKLGIFLGVLAGIAAGLLSWVSSSTAEAIEANLQKKTATALKQVLPEFDSTVEMVFESELGWPVKYYVAKQGEQVVGFAGEVITPEGFSGNITVMVGLELDASVRKVIVTAHAETPGLGTAITDRKVQKTLMDLLSGKKAEAGLPPNRYLDWYMEKSAGTQRWPIIKDGDDVNGKTGATVTSAAIGGAVFAISETGASHLTELLKGQE